MTTPPKGPTAPVIPEVPRRVVDIPGKARRPTEPRSDMPTDTGRRLLVGREITLAGEISACDHLVVEGKIEAKLRDCRTIEIADGGVFKGAAEIEEANISGRFEGDLTVRGRLRVGSTGVVSGSVRYGELEVQVGGRLIGTIDPLESVVTPMPDTGVHYHQDGEWSVRFGGLSRPR